MLLAAVALLTGPARAQVSNRQSGLFPEAFFERNDGQAPSGVMYLAYGSQYSVNLEKDGLSLVLYGVDSVKGRSVSRSKVVRLRFIGASAQTVVEGIEEQKGKSNYFSGPDPAHWQTRVPHFARVVYHQVYPGIDVVFYLHGGQLEYDFNLQPGADPDAVRLGVEGADGTLDAQGDLVIRSAQVEICRMKKPKAYQPGANQRPIAAKYSLRDHVLGVLLASYNRNQPLVIDPALAFSTFLGSNCVFDPNQVQHCDAAINDVAVDNTGIYLVGATNASSFPAQPGQPAATSLPLDRTVVVKLDPTGSTVIYTTFLASSGGTSIAVDSSGAAYVIGMANFGPGVSPLFPLTNGSFSTNQPAAGNGALPYAAKLSSDGSTLVYSTFLLEDSGNPQQLIPLDEILLSKVAVDSNGALYINGVEKASAHADFTSVLPFPTTVGAFQTVRPGDLNLFVMKLNPGGSALGYSTYIGAVVDVAGGLAVDSDGSAYVSASAAAGYPTTPGAYQTTNADPSAFSDAVVTKLSADGSSLVYSTYYGGPGDDESLALALTPAREAVLVGWGFDPPTTAGAVCSVSATLPLAVSAFAAKLNATGTGLVYATTLCNSQTFEQGSAVAVDSSGAAYVAAFVDKGPDSPFPLLTPIQGYLFPGSTITNGIVSLDTSGGLQWGTFLGPSSPGIASQRIAVDSGGAVYFLGSLLTTAGALEPVPRNEGTYLAKIVPSLGAPVPVLQPRAISFLSQVTGSTSAPVDVVVGNFGDATLAAPVITITGDFLQTNSCTTSIPGGQKCDVNVVFKPTGGGTRTGTLTVNFGGGLSDQTVALTGLGTAPTATPSPAALGFPPQMLNTTSKAQPISILNHGTGPLQITSIHTTGDFAQTSACGSPIQQTSSCTIQVTFTPSAQGNRTGSLILTDNAPDSPQTVPLSGFGQASIVSLSANSVTFTAQNVGSTSPSVPVTVTNIGNISLNVSGITVAGDFSQTNDCSTVQPGASCTVQVRFSPTVAEQRAGTLKITDDSITSPEIVTLHGSGFDFSFLTGPSIGTISAGQVASYTLTANSLGGSSATVAFSCSGAPALSTCTITPTSATLTGTPQNFAVNISTTAASTALKSTGASPALPFLLPAVALACAVVMLRRQKRVRWAVFASLGVALLWIGCGGGNVVGSRGGGGISPGTPSGTYTITVTATVTSGSSTLAHSTNLTLIVK